MCFSSRSPLLPDATDAMSMLVYNGSSNSTMNFDLDSVTITVPEPSTYAMMTGLAALGFTRWRRRTKAAAV